MARVARGRFFRANVEVPARPKSFELALHSQSASTALVYDESSTREYQWFTDMLDPLSDLPYRRSKRLRLRNLRAEYICSTEMRYVFEMAYIWRDGKYSRMEESGVVWY
jgi:hypothetical protein